MSVFCPKCGKRTYNEYKCDFCQYEIKKRDYKESNKSKSNKIILNQNKIIIIALIIIATALAYIAYSDSKGNKKNLMNKSMLGKEVKKAEKTLTNMVNIPKFKIPESQYEKEQKLKKAKAKREAIRKERILYNTKRKEDKAKEELKKQMNL